MTSAMFLKVILGLFIGVYVSFFIASLKLKLKNKWNKADIISDIRNSYYYIISPTGICIVAVVFLCYMLL